MPILLFWFVVLRLLIVSDKWSSITANLNLQINLNLEIGREPQTSDLRSFSIVTKCPEAAEVVWRNPGHSGDYTCHLAVRWVSVLPEELEIRKIFWLSRCTQSFCISHNIKGDWNCQPITQQSSEPLGMHRTYLHNHHIIFSLAAILLS